MSPAVCKIMESYLSLISLPKNPFGKPPSPRPLAPVHSSPPQQNLHPQHCFGIGSSKEVGRKGIVAAMIAVRHHLIAVGHRCWMIALGHPSSTMTAVCHRWIAVGHHRWSRIENRVASLAPAHGICFVCVCVCVRVSLVSTRYIWYSSATPARVATTRATRVRRSWRQRCQRFSEQQSNSSALKKKCNHAI